MTEYTTDKHAANFLMLNYYLFAVVIPLVVCALHAMMAMVIIALSAPCGRLAQGANRPLVLCHFERVRAGLASSRYENSICASSTDGPVKQ